MAPIRIPYPPPNPLTLDLRDKIIHFLLAAGFVKTLNNELLQACQTTGWLDAVRQRTLQLLRSEQCATYSDVMDVLMREIWNDWEKDSQHIKEISRSQSLVSGGLRDPGMSQYEHR